MGRCWRSRTSTRRTARPSVCGTTPGIRGSSGSSWTLARDAGGSGTALRASSSIWLHQWGRTSGLSQCWELESTRNGRTRIRNVLADKYIDLVGMNTSNGAQAQIWNYVSGGNQEWNLVRVDPDTAQTNARAEEKRDPEPTPSQRKHQNDLVRKLNNAGKGRAARK